ncbi:MAG TPA: hypothetical protein VJQ56_09970 [Blastocatellia bacterium]|nr:hypothetical protein [Blastocatellia bacterium]
MKVLLAIIMLFSFTAVAAAQQSRGAKPSDPEDPTDPFSQLDHIPAEMRKRMARERAEDEHRKVLEDVKKLDDLSSEVIKEYRGRGKFLPEEMKKIVQIEKLAKRILSGVGGNEVQDEGATPPVSIAEALDQLNAAVTSIKKSMMTETRFVVSAMVVANSNEVINLAQFIRRNQKQSD